MRLRSKRTLLFVAGGVGIAALVLVAAAAAEGRSPQSMIASLAGDQASRGGGTGPAGCCPPPEACSGPPTMQPLAGSCCGCCYWALADSAAPQPAAPCGYQCGSVACCASCGPAACLDGCPILPAPKGA